MTALSLTHRAAARRLGERRGWPRRAARTLGAVLAACALAVGGLWLGTRLSTPGTYPSALGTASFQVRLSGHGGVEVYIPLADWGLRAHAFSAPITLHVEPRVLNRPALLAAASGERDVLSRTARNLAADGRRAMARAARFWILGVLIAAACGWSVLRLAGCRSRRLLVAIPAGTVLAAALLGAATLWRVQSTWNADALGRPTYFARGSELIQLLNAADHASAIKDSYAGKIQGALSGFAGLLADPAAGAVDGDRRALLVSDLHDNTLALSSLGFYAQGQPVFFVGDFGNTGDASEIKALVPAVAGPGREVIAVSGDHDSHALMLALAARGAIVLTSRGELQPSGRFGARVADVDGLRVAGFDDPMESRSGDPDSPQRIFSFGQLPDPGRAVTRARDRLLEWFESLPQRPDVVLIHENGLAQYLAQFLYDTGYRSPLTILTGHDHIQHVNEKGPVVVVDAGTVGASGLYGIGSDYVGLGELHWAPRAPLLRAADLIQVEPVTGGAQAQRVVISDTCSLTHTECTSAVDYLDPREGPSTSALDGATPVSPLAPQLNASVP